MNFNLQLMANLKFGRGEIQNIGKYAKNYGSKVLIVTGRNSTKKTGLLDLSITKLIEEGLSVEVFDKVEQNPLTTIAQEGAKVAVEKKCDLVIGIGGGSIMDCAKAIALLALNKGDVNDYLFGRNQATTALPILLVPTTCGTGSEANGFSVLTNPTNGDKKSLRGTMLIPQISIIDSTLMETMPKTILASVCFDALCHCIEAYTSKMNQPIIDSMVLYALKLIGSNIQKVYDENLLEKFWDEMTLASTIGGIAIYAAGVTLPHAMEHPVSGLKDVAHGKGLAAITPKIIEKSIKGCPDRYATISKMLGGNSEEDCAEIVKKILEKIQLTCTLRDFGIDESDLEWLSENCMKVSSVSIMNHPVKFKREDICKIYEACL